jgi:hypothetical protein
MLRRWALSYHFTQGKSIHCHNLSIIRELCDLHAAAKLAGSLTSIQVVC